jgi:hypothetical protein
MCRRFNDNSVQPRFYCFGFPQSLLDYRSYRNQQPSYCPWPPWFGQQALWESPLVDKFQLSATGLLLSVVVAAWTLTSQPAVWIANVNFLSDRIYIAMDTIVFSVRQWFFPLGLTLDYGRTPDWVVHRKFPTGCPRATGHERSRSCISTESFRGSGCFCHHVYSPRFWNSAVYAASLFNVRRPLSVSAGLGRSLLCGFFSRPGTQSVAPLGGVIEAFASWRLAR